MATQALVRGAINDLFDFLCKSTSHLRERVDDFTILSTESTVLTFVWSGLLGLSTTE